MNFKNRIFKNINKILAVTSIALLCSNITYADIYLKAFGGNTLSSAQLNGDAPLIIGGSFTITTEHNKVSTANLFSPGLSLGMLAPVYNKVRLGLEATAEYQVQEHNFKLDIDSTSTSMLEVANLEVKLQNKYRALLALVLEINKSFYIKAGPSLLNQNITTYITPSSDPNEISNTVSNKDTENLIGALFGAGFTYRITNSLGIFTEFNYTYYKDKSLSDFIASGAAIQPTTPPDDFYHTNRNVKISQADFSLGFVFTI